MKDRILDALAVSAAWAVTIVFIGYFSVSLIAELITKGPDL